MQYPICMIWNHLQRQRNWPKEQDCGYPRASVSPPQLSGSAAYTITVFIHHDGKLGLYSSCKSSSQPEVCDVIMVTDQRAEYQWRCFLPVKPTGTTRISLQSAN
eukprot:scpid7324/ scgid27550/ 